mmetsp:Transcript_9698/g.21578  ORF Transcript_9698/g.21578 Transcript_9698/m.21578 type:complete len:226 (+) Transcript_9698:717-1394(+)|eukprot:CAMPEP_0113324230 /NCGR_PEP_ID=MMETSP0010_2-20120614/16894_1 /TAXON_ID=216773 ORGANISM="Corethron hystrix, Strain 308" /NCGR_SAMPLE_ID=MMETSP0010_2 /ASSEMBLY_ACC=CAM_ASM_000155 /LENGTH=225 /DNA_ID=CAMNT_0000183515 /DNA_START=470 /DNA_END=1147 /DNA_ORIENTATION=+ /assembly_acc=CAM_ASM_000155
MESGGTRNYQVWRDKEKVEAEIKAEKSGDTSGADAMKALEDRVADSQREMEDLDNLDEIKAMNARHMKMMRTSGRPSGAEDVRRVLSAVREAEEKEELTEHGTTAEEEAQMAKIKFGSAAGAALSSLHGRDGDEEEEDERRERDRRAKNEALFAKSSASKCSNNSSEYDPQQGIKSIISIKRKRPRVVVPQKTSSALPILSSTASSEGNDLGALLGTYESSDDSD